MSKPKAPGKLNYEEAFEELEALVIQLESGELPLEQALVLFERGQALSARCSELLEKAELKIHQLVSDDAGGFIETDFEVEDD